MIVGHLGYVLQPLAGALRAACLSWCCTMEGRPLRCCGSHTLSLRTLSSSSQTPLCDSNVFTHPITLAVDIVTNACASCWRHKAAVPAKFRN